MVTVYDYGHMYFRQKIGHLTKFNNISLSDKLLKKYLILIFHFITLLKSNED